MGGPGGPGGPAGPGGGGVRGWDDTSTDPIPTGPAGASGSPGVTPADGRVSLPGTTGASRHATCVPVVCGGGTLAPVGVADSYTTPIGTVLQVGLEQGVLANDSDPDTPRSALVAVLDDPPASGTVELSSTGSFRYEPDAGYRGRDAFTYRVTDGENDSEETTVSLVVDTAPVVVSELLPSGRVEVPLEVEAPGVLANDSDADDDALSAVLVSQPSHGTVSLAQDGSLTYTPDAGWAGGEDSFTYRVSDGLLASGLGTAHLRIVGPPVARPDAYRSTAGARLVVPAVRGVLANDTAPGGGAMTAALATQPARGTVTMGSTGGFTYTPRAGFAGFDSFTYRSSVAGEHSAPARVVLTIQKAGSTTTASAALLRRRGRVVGVRVSGRVSSAVDPTGYVRITRGSRLLASPRLDGANRFAVTIPVGTNGVSRGRNVLVVSFPGTTAILRSQRTLRVTVPR